MNCILVLLGRATGGQADGRVYIGGNIIAFAFVNFILQVQRRVPATEHLPSGGGINLVGWMRLMRSSTPNRTETDRLADRPSTEKPPTRQHGSHVNELMELIPQFAKYTRGQSVSSG